MGNSLSCSPCCNRNSNGINCCKNPDAFDYENDYGYSMISLDKKEYKPSDTVKGVLYIKLYSDFPAKDIKLYLCGYTELLYFHLRESKLEKCYEKNIEYDDWYTLQKNDKNLTKGDYSFNFSFKLKNKLPNSYQFKYKDDGKKAYSKCKYFLIGGVIKDNKIDHSLLSNKIPIYINDEKINSMSSKLVDTINISKNCSNLISIKAKLEFKDQNQKCMYGGEDNSFILKLEGIKSKKRIIEVNLSLVGSMEVHASGKEKDVKIKTFYEKYLGSLNEKENKNFEFNINKRTIDSTLSSIKSKNINHYFYFKIDLICENINQHLILSFPQIIKNSKPLKIKSDTDFKNFEGNKSIFKNFNPKNIIINLEKQKPEVIKFYKKLDNFD